MSEHSPAAEPQPQPGVSSRANVYPIVKIDHRGDLILVVHEGKNESGGAKRGFLVCSRTLARATKYFDTMLYGSWRKSLSSNCSDRDPKSAAQWTVSVFEDPPDAFQVMLNVVHGNMDKVPEKMDRSLLSKIIILADKYVMTESLRRVVHIWHIRHSEPYNKRPGWCIDLDLTCEHPDAGVARAHLIVAHFMGHESAVWRALVYYATMFRLAGSELILNRRYRVHVKDGVAKPANLKCNDDPCDGSSSCNDDGSVEDGKPSATEQTVPDQDEWVSRRETERLSDELQGLPSIYTDAIFSLRHNFIAALLRWTAMMLAQASYQPLCYSGDQEWTSPMLKDMRKVLERNRVWPLPKPKEWERSVFDLHGIVFDTADWWCASPEKQNKEAWFQVWDSTDGTDFKWPNGSYEYLKDWKRSRATCPNREAITADLEEQAKLIDRANANYSDLDSDSDSGF